MSNNNHSGSFAGKGYVLALILCAAAIGVAGFLYSKNDEAAEPASLLETQEELVMGEEATGDIPVLATDPRPSAPESSTTAPPPTQAPRAPLKTMSPVSGDPIYGYSVEALSYNQTTRDWRVHAGLDLAAEEGEPVAAAADGEVYTTFMDDALGATVVIRHRDGYTTRYSSLSEELAVKPGDTVTMGDIIGYASDTAITEGALGAHVHFSVTGQEGPMDPAEFLAMGQ